MLRLLALAWVLLESGAAGLPKIFAVCWVQLSNWGEFIPLERVAAIVFGAGSGLLLGAKLIKTPPHSESKSNDVDKRLWFRSATGYTISFMLMLCSFLITVDELGLASGLPTITWIASAIAALAISLAYGRSAAHYASQAFPGKKTSRDLSQLRHRWFPALVPLGIAILTLTFASVGQKNLRRIRVTLDDTPTHLGDNIFNTFGVNDPAQIPDPGVQDKQNLVFYNKETGQFEASSLSNTQMAIMQSLASNYSEIDLSSYRHVRLVDESELAENGLNPLPSPRVVPFGDKFLIWKENRGNFHDSMAAVFVSYRVDLATPIRAEFPTKDEALPVEAVLVVVQVTHGGAPQGEGGQVWLFINGHVEDLSEKFRRHGGQTMETIEVDVTPWISLGTEKPINDIGLITTPIFESNPIPGPGFANSGARPVHFRDVMINRVELWADIAID